MSFVLRMAWRETRTSWARLLFFFLCVALGVASIVLLRSVVQTVRITLVREARNLVGADLIVQSPRAWSPEIRQRIDTLLASPGVRDTTEIIETSTMAAAVQGTSLGAVRLVEVRGVEAKFPYYGTIELAGGRTYAHALVEGHGVLVTPELLAVLGLSEGGQIRIAGQTFTIRGVVTKDRIQRGGGFAFGPRVYVDLADLKNTMLLGFGSRATRQILVQVDTPKLAALTERVKDAFTRDVVTVRSWQGVEDRLGRNLTLAEDYLSLVGFAIVVLGGIGVWSVTRVLVQQKIRSVAILKCLGATSKRVLGTYLVQVLWLALAGSLLGVVLGALGIAAIPTSVIEPLGVSHVSVTPSAAAQGLAVGLLVSLLFALVPLLEIRQVKPLLLLRADTVNTARRRDRYSVLAGVATIAALVLVAGWQAGSLRVGLYVTAGLGAVATALLLVSRVLIRVVSPLARTRRFALRHAVISLGRPGNQTRVILMAVGLGCFFILTVRALQANILESFAVEIGRNAPDLVLIDIQPDQADGVRATVGPYLRAPARMLPLLRARVVGVDGQRLHLPTADDVRKQGELTREYGLTFRDGLAENEKVTAGTFWQGPLTERHTTDGLDTEVSIEEMARDQAGVEVGDVMRFDIGAVIVSARVTSMRKVTWDDSQNGGFMFVLRPGPAVARVPHTFVGFLQTKPDAAGHGALERAMVTGFPNVSIIDVRDVVASLEEVVGHATLGVTVVGGVTIAGGVLILIGAVAMTKFQRLYETAVYRTLGASTRLIASMITIEYGLLGALAGLFGAGGAWLLSWAIATRLFDITWHPVPGLLVGGVVVATAAVGIVGLAASADVLVTKPLGILRRE